MPEIKSRILTEIYLDEIKFSDGKEVHYVSFKYPESVAILPVLNGNRVILVKQYRYSIKEYSWEIPAGSIQDDESLEDAARRELFEETGYTAKKIIYLLSFFPSNAMSNEKIHIFKALDIKSSETRVKRELLEKNIELKSFNIDQLKSMIKNGEITDAATIIGIQQFILSN